MGILGVIACAIAKIIEKILEIILFLIQTVFYFLETAISFPLFTDEETFRAKNVRFQNTSNLNSIKAFSICFLTSVFLIIIGDILFNLLLIICKISGVFPDELEKTRINLPSFGENENQSSDLLRGIMSGLGEIIRFVLQIIVELLHLFIKSIIVITFICIIAELFFLVFSVLLYVLDLYILLRKNIHKLPNTETGLILDVDSKDSLILNFIAGLLVLPVGSTILVGMFLFLIGTFYKMILSFWILPSGSRVAIPLLNEIISLIISFFSLEKAVGKATRMLIGLFWMLIGLSSFRYRPQQDIFREMKHVSSTPSVSGEGYYCPSDVVFIQNYVLLFLLLFDPIISLTLIFYLKYVVIPL